MDRESVCDLLKYPWRPAMMYSDIIHGQFVPTLTFCRSHDRLRVVKDARGSAAAGRCRQKVCVDCGL